MFRADISGMTAFGPSPIVPNTPSLVQASFIAQHAAGAKPREKTKPQEADPRRVFVLDEVRLSDPLKAEAIDPKPDAVEEWKQGRGRLHPHNVRANATAPRADTDGNSGHLDVKG